MSEKNNLLMWSVVGVLAVAVFAAVAYKLRMNQSEQIIVQAELDTSCDLNKDTCTLTLPDKGKVTFSVEPRPIPVIEQLKLVVETEEIEADAITVDFSGVDMNMGINRFAMRMTGEGSYQGNGILPVCVRNRMTWEAKVMIQTDNGIVVAPFRFDTSHR